MHVHIGVLGLHLAPIALELFSDQLSHRVALRSGVLGVAAHIEVQAGTIGEEDVAAAAPCHDAAEQVAGDLIRRQAPLPLECAGDAVLGLDAEDAPFHGRLLAALLHEALHELLGVLLQHGVDLVEQVGDVEGRGARRGEVDLLVLLLTGGLAVDGLAL